MLKVKRSCGAGGIPCVAAALWLLLVASAAQVGAAGCAPTPWDEIGPFYKPGAPVRSVLGRGYLLSGTVRSSRDCAPIPGARVEIWHASPNGSYDDAHRATLYADRSGRYRLETSLPAGYASRPPHIHILVDAKGFEGLVTQHYPKKRAAGASFDLVLVPEKAEGGASRGGELVRPGKKPGRARGDAGS